MKKISWFTPQSNDLSGEQWYSPGYQNAAIANIKELNAMHVAVYYNKPEIPYHINFCQPVYYQHNNDYVVGYTPWESTVVPSSWLYNMSLCDEIWTTSNFVKDVFSNYNVNNNIYVIHHGVSPEFTILDREITDKFNFLHVGGESLRKNSQMVVDAFLDLFDGNKNYRLILKYNNKSNAKVRINNELVDASKHPQIVCLEHSLNTQDLIELYHKSHCMIYPTKGEGFGMIPFEAIATGMPTIVTNATGTADFAEMSFALNAEMAEAKEQSEYYGVDTGLWAYPSYDHLLELMRQVVDDYDAAKRKTIQSAKIIHDSWRWTDSAAKIYDRYQDFVGF